LAPTKPLTADTAAPPCGASSGARAGGSRTGGEPPARCRSSAGRPQRPAGPGRRHCGPGPRGGRRAQSGCKASWAAHARPAHPATRAHGAECGTCRSQPADPAHAACRGPSGTCGLSRSTGLRASQNRPLLPPAEVGPQEPAKPPKDQNRRRAGG
jgi:hypothetical protein